jgi:hypothetical protein
MRARRQGVTVVVAVIAVLSMGAGGVTAAEGAPTDAAGDADPVVWRLTNVDTGESYTVSADEPLSAADLPAGDYRAVGLDSDGDAVASRTLSVEGVTAASHRDLEVSVTHAEQFELSYDAGDTVDLWVGVRNESSGEYVANADVTVSLTRPDGTVVNVTGTTDQYGTAVAAFDTSGEPEGRYDVENVYVDGHAYPTFGEVIVGDYAGFKPEFNAVTEAGEESTIALQVSEGRSPVDGYQSTVTVARTGQPPLTSQQVQTDSSGVATVSFTPPEPGTYTVQADGTGDTFSRVQVGDGVALLFVEGETFGDETAGEPVTISGQVIRDDTPLANSQLTLEIVNVTDFDDTTTAATLSATTDGQGTFNTSWQTPSAVPGNADYEVRVSDASGATIAVQGADRFRVEQPATGGGGDPVQVDISEREFGEVAPGGQKTFDVEVTDNGTGVATQVTVETFLDFDSVLVDRQTVQTDSDGEATVTVPVPSDAPYAGSINAEATATVDGTTASSDEFVGISARAVEFGFGDTARPDEQYTGTWTVTDPATGSGLSGVQVTQVVYADEFGLDVYGAATAQTDGSGEVEFTTDVPANARGAVQFDPLAPRSDTFGSIEYVQAYDVSVDGLSDTYDAGERVTFSVSSASPATTSAIVNVDVGGETVAARQVTAGEQVSLTVPADADSGADADVRVRAMDANGDTGWAFGDFDVGQGGDGDDGDDGDGALFTEPIPGAGGEGPPTDPDGDGEYEDVDGSGTATFDDAIALAFADTSGLTGDQVDALDFDGDGDVDFDDAVSLAFQV